MPDTKTFGDQVPSNQRVDFDGKVFVSYEYWDAQRLDRIFAGQAKEKPKVQDQQKPVFGKRAA